MTTEFDSPIFTRGSVQSLIFVCTSRPFSHLHDWFEQSVNKDAYSRQTWTSALTLRGSKLMESHTPSPRFRS